MLVLGAYCTYPYFVLRTRVIYVLLSSFIYCLFHVMIRLILIPAFLPFFLFSSVVAYLSTLRYELSFLCYDIDPDCYSSTVYIV